MVNQNDIEALQDLIQRGEITADQANVEMVRIARVQVVKSLPASVRSALNAAVKDGILSHKKKDGRKPEVYYHPDFEHLADEERGRIEMETLNAIAKVLAV